MAVGRLFKRLGLVALALAVLIAIPVGRNELACMQKSEAAASPYKPLLPAQTHRNLVDSYLTFPEWSIVHAYEDFAGVMRKGSESDFGYWASVSGFWSNLCSLSSHASRQGEIKPEMKAMLYIIGVSFSAEMAVKGLYESTLGRLTAWIRGPVRTAEDEFALKVADDYAVFLRQTPWYDYPFWPTLRRFWSETEMGKVSWVRSIERRVALTMEFGVKSVYAKVIGLLAAADPAKLTIDTLVTGMSRDRLAADPAVTIKGETANGIWVETARYRAFTQFLQRIAAAEGRIREIAGNDRIFVTVIQSIEKPGEARPPGDPSVLLEVPIQSRPGFVRRGIVVAAMDLSDRMRQLERAGATFEHAYDY
jgi:hypothetical protein